MTVTLTTPAAPAAAAGITTVMVLSLAIVYEVTFALPNEIAVVPRKWLPEIVRLPPPLVEPETVLKLVTTGAILE